MRILHVLDHSLPLHSGYTFRTLAILREQRALGWETFHLTSEKQENCSVLEEIVDGWHFYRTRPYAGMLQRIPGTEPLQIMKGVESRLEALVLKIKPDVIHAHSPALNAIPASLVGRRLGIPVVYEIRAFWEDAAVDHGTTEEGSLRYRMGRWLENRAIHSASAVTTICEGLRRDIVGRGVDPGKITVIPNAVDVENFSMNGEASPALRSELGLDGKKVIGFLGSFYAYEGLDLLVDAMPDILTSVPEARLLLVGGGFQEEALKARVQRLGLNDRVVFTGRVPHQDIQSYYNLVDLLVYPRHSMRLTELVTPLKPLEAMAQGKVVLASDVGGHKELIADKETGFLFKADDRQDLARYASQILNGFYKTDGVIRSGRRFVETERTWKASVARYADLYARITGRPA